MMYTPSSSGLVGEDQCRVKGFHFPFLPSPLTTGKGQAWQWGRGENPVGCPHSSSGWLGGLCFAPTLSPP